jgi:hypothetical protein
MGWPERSFLLWDQKKQKFAGNPTVTPARARQGSDFTSSDRRVEVSEKGVDSSPFRPITSSKPFALHTFLVRMILNMLKKMFSTSSKIVRLHIRGS